MKSVKKTNLVAFWTLLHFTVDFGCFILLYGILLPTCRDLQELGVGFLLYNVIAFGLQPFIGYYCDKHPTIRRTVGIAGCAIVALTVGCSGFVMEIFQTFVVEEGVIRCVSWISMMVAAVGNAAFHVGGGTDVLVESRGKIAPNGIFVSAGALGVALGTKLGGQNIFVIYALVAAVVVVIAVLHRQMARCSNIAARVDFPIINSLSLPLAIFLLFFAVAVRAFVGAVAPIDWERTGLLVLLPSCAACIGKALGGIVGDRFGAGRTGVLSLLLSIPLLCWGRANPISSLTGVLLFNMAMPLTLCALAGTMPENPGFAFGLTTLALLLGSAVTFFLAVPEGILIPLMALLILAAAVSVGVTIKMKKGKNKNEGKTEKSSK